jgi:hypothetical protein
LLTFALVTNIYAELKNNKTTLKVELTNVLHINQTKEIKAKFIDLLQLYLQSHLFLQQLYLIVAILADLHFLHLVNFHLLFLMPLLFFYLDETVNITEVACPIRYSIDDLKAYEQKSINTVDSNGNTLSVGACLDSGVSCALKRFFSFKALTACIKISLSTLTLIFCGGNIC